MNKEFKYPKGQEILIKSFIREIYDENEYDRFNINIKEGDIVLDAGANVGIFTQYALDRGASKVIAYECEESNFQYYNENINDNRVSCTMGYVGHNNYDLTKIFEQHNIDKIDFAKIDIEADEWEMFKNMKDEDMIKVEKWAIEFHTQFYNSNVVINNKLSLLWGFLQILEKFTLNNYEIKFEHIHKGWDVVHLYAKLKR